MFRRFGSQVTIVQRGKQLFAREDDDVAEDVAKIRREDGITIMLETAVLRAENSVEGKINMTYKVFI